MCVVFRSFNYTITYNEMPNIIQKDFKVTKDRGIWYKKGKLNIIATYHPAAALYRRQTLEYIQEDFYKLNQLLIEKKETT